MSGGGSLRQSICALDRNLGDCRKTGAGRAWRQKGRMARSERGASPAMGLQRASDAARRPFCLAPHGLRSFWRWPSRRGDLTWSRGQGYRHCARALASAKKNSNATHSSISAVSLGRDVRRDGSIGLHGCEAGDETAQTEAHRGLHNTRVESRGRIGSGAALPSGGTVKEGALSNAGSVATKYDPSARDPR